MKIRRIRTQSVNYAYKGPNAVLIVLALLVPLASLPDVRNGLAVWWGVAHVFHRLCGFRWHDSVLPIGPIYLFWQVDNHNIMCLYFLSVPVVPDSHHGRRLVQVESIAISPAAVTVTRQSLYSNATEPPVRTPSGRGSNSRSSASALIA
jgi:hypothetical protein